MRKIRALVLLQICCLGLATAAMGQVKNNVARLHAFVQETVAGNVEVDQHGNQLNSGVDRIHHLFAETTGKYLPQWNVVYTNNGVFAVQAEEIKKARFEVGKLKSTQKPLFIAAKRGNRLWKLTLMPMKAAIPAHIAPLLKKNQVVVVTEWKGRQFTHAIAKEIQLEPVFYE